MTDQERNERAYIILRQMLSQHFHGKGLHFDYVDRSDLSLEALDKELYLKIMEIMPEVTKT